MTAISESDEFVFAFTAGKADQAGRGRARVASRQLHLFNMRYLKHRGKVLFCCKPAFRVVINFRVYTLVIQGSNKQITDKIFGNYGWEIKICL